MLTETAELTSVNDRADQSTIAREIKRWSELQPEQAAVVLFEHAPLSYRQLQYLIESWREDLRAAGLRRDARIAISFPHGPQAALATIAVAWIVHRPLIGGLLLVGAVAAMFLLRQLHPRRPARVAA